MAISRVQCAVALLFLATIYRCDGAAVVKNCYETKKSPLNIAVIGAGASGLTTARHAIAQGHYVTVFEQNDQLGGVWVYTDDVGTMKNGLKVHTAMYKGLRTNIPYQLMEFPDYHHPNNTIPFPTQPTMLEFLNSYADYFQLKDHIEFNAQVIRVLPIENERWEVIIKDLLNGEYITETYDAVFVANGHFFAPNIPHFEGISEFKGKMLHSHDYRSPDKFKGEHVMVIGASASGLDLVNHLSNVAKSVTLSQNKPPHQTKEAREKRRKSLPAGTILKDNVKRFTADGAEFIDGTTQPFTVVIFATGYKYSYPFLSVDTGIHVEDNFVQPLYKQILNIEHPTMAFIGIPSSAPNFHMFDLQARFALKFLSGEKKLPSKYELMKESRADTQVHWNKGYPKHKTHYLGVEQREYFNQLADVADIKNLPLVYSAMHFDASNGLRDQPTTFRKYKYTIIDDKTYAKEQYED